ITRAMDDFDLSEGRGRLGDVLEGVNIPTLVMGISSDVLYPENEQKALVDALPQAHYARINSPHGHDAFLIEFPQIAVHVRSFLERTK
ncbi:MAG: homoserine acetyltransferase, partial [Deinococcales bacterium]|nr:homoserine acetyltransferase [Deinococcales bacterium]